MDCHSLEKLRATTLAVLVAAILVFLPTVLFAQECAERKDISLLMAIDISSSMAGTRITAARNFAVSLLDELIATVDPLSGTSFLEEAASFQFCSQTIAENFWQSPNTVRSALAGLSITCAHPDLAPFDGTSLNNALVFGANETRTRPASNIRLFVALTDGEDTSSQNVFPFATQAHAASALSGGDIVGRLVFIGQIGPGSAALDAIAAAAGPTVQPMAELAADLLSLVDDIVDATCVNFRPDARILLHDVNGNSDDELRLGHEGFDITFNGSGSSDVDGSIVDYRWTFTRPNGSTFTRNGPLQIVTFNDSQLPHGENWSVVLEVEDDDGATHSTTATFRVVGSPPNISIMGPAEIEPGETLTLSVVPTSDIDGGGEWTSVVWDIMVSPPSSTHQQVNDFARGLTLTLPIVESDIGTWTFRATATDNEGDTGPLAQHTLEVNNLPPEIELIGTSRILVGETIQVETTKLEDRDGGELTFQWDIVQARQGAIPMVQEAYRTGTGVAASFIDIPTDYSHAGTWIFRLTATDDDGAANSETSAEFPVLVDAPPEAEIQCTTCTPASSMNDRGDIGSQSFPLVLDGSGSVDPDSPCLDRTDRCHDRLEGGLPEEISSPIDRYTWTLVDVPWELFAEYPLGNVGDALGVSADNPTLVLNSGVIEPGEWVFQLEVRDGEGNTDFASFSALVVDESAPPLAIVIPPFARYTVDTLNTTASDVEFIGSLSLDIDNVLSGEPLPGIDDYSWVVNLAPPGCTPPTAPSGASATEFQLYSAGTAIDPVCHGNWKVGLTVTDDDSPAEENTTAANMVIGNCLEHVCIDFPTQQLPEVVEFTEDTDILIFYHLDSALYNIPVLGFGMFAYLEIFHESDLATPVMTDYDPNLLASDRGSHLVFHWNGLSNTNQLPKSGRYTVRISLVDVDLAPTGIQATEVNAILIAAAEPTILPSSSKYIDHAELLADTDRITVDFELRGSAIVDELLWRVCPQQVLDCTSDTATFEDSVPPVSSGTIEWDGIAAGATIPPGSYAVRIEAFRGGVSLGESLPHEFHVYEIRLEAVSSDPGTQDTEGIFVPGSRLPTVVTPANFGELQYRMRPVRVEVSPDIAGSTVELSYVSGSDANLELYLADPPHTLVGLTKTWVPADFTSSRPNALLEVPMLAYGKAFGDVKLKLAFKDGVTVVAEREILFRVEPFPGLVGVGIPGTFPFFRVVRTINEGVAVTIGLDPVRHRERIGKVADVYLVAHKSPAAWAADPTLTDVTGGPIPITVSPGSIASNINTLWVSSTPGKYDVVIDFGNFADDPAEFAADSTLNPGDILDQVDGAPSVSVFGNYTTPGPLPTAADDYGMGGAPTTVFVPDGYDGLTAVPLAPGFGFRLRGRVVHPSPLPPLPVRSPLVVFAHGNHTPLNVDTPPFGPHMVNPALTSEENFRGHTYLQNHLASRGFVTLSVDLDEMHGSPNLGYPNISSFGIKLRAWIILKNIENLLTDVSIAGGALVGKIDTSRIYLIGHSRGGEAVLQALHLLNSPADRPSGGSLAGFGAADIRGVVGLAPGTWSLESGSLAAHSVPFLLLYGTADGDVHGAKPRVMPFRHYDRSLNDHFAIVLEGGNHNHWNTSWGYSDAEFIATLAGVPGDFTSIAVTPLATGPVGAIATLVGGAEQRNFAKAYIAAFLDLIDQGKAGVRAYFLEPPAKLRPLGVDPGLIQHSQSRRMAGVTKAVLDDFESPLGAFVTETAESSSGQTVANTVANIAEEELQDRDLTISGEEFNRFFQETRGGLMDWVGTSEYVQPLPPAERDLRGAHVISFRVAQQPDHTETLALAADMVFQVELEDGSGDSSAVNFSILDTVPDIYPSEVPGIVTTSAVFKTYRLPIAGFVADGRRFDLGNVVAVRFLFAQPGDSPRGRIAIDDLEIEK